MKRTLRLLSPLLLAGSAAAQVPTQINVEIDYMVSATHSHEPPQIVLDALVQMFACQGISLNLIVDDAVPHTNVLQCDDPMANFWTCPGANAFSNYEGFYRDQGAGWHYCIIGHQYALPSGVTNSSGRSNGFDSFIVTLGGLTQTDFRIASTFAHELGHDLGLNHSAPGSGPGAGPYSKNYASVMSYEYQLNGVKDRMETLGIVGADHLFKNLDYSRGRLPSLWEPVLLEPDGLGIVPIDWDCNGLIEPGAVWTELDDQGGWCTSNVGGTTLYDGDDWADIEDNTDASKREHAQTRDWICPGPEAVDGLSEEDQPTLVVEPCVTAEMYWLDPSGNILAAGTGEDPMSNVAFSASNAPAGSIFYLQPGTFTNFGSPITITNEILLTGIGGALIDPAAP